MARARRSVTRMVTSPPLLPPSRVHVPPSFGKATHSLVEQTESASSRVAGPVTLSPHAMATAAIHELWRRRTVREGRAIAAIRRERSPPIHPDHLDPHARAVHVHDDVVIRLV